MHAVHMHVHVPTEVYQSEGHPKYNVVTESCHEDERANTLFVHYEAKRRRLVIDRKIIETTNCLITRHPKRPTTRLKLDIFLHCKVHITQRLM